MESGDSCSRLRRNFLLHLGQYHQSDDAFEKSFWRALDAYRRDHSKVGKGNYCLLGDALVRFGWFCQLWMLEMLFWKAGLMVWVWRIQVDPLLVEGIGEDVG